MCQDANNSLPLVHPSSFAPLHWPSGSAPTSTRFEKALVFLPIIGWAIGMASYRYRMKSCIENIRDQLKGRTPPSDLWGTDRLRGHHARELSVIIADEVGWPNSYFIPEDPIKILLFSPLGDGGEGLAIFHGIATKLGIDGREGGLFLHRITTFGEFVDYYDDIIRRSRGQQKHYTEDGGEVAKTGEVL